MGQERPKELADLSVVQAFYVSLVEAHLGHSLPLPADLKQPADTADGSRLTETLKFWLDFMDRP